MEIYELDDSFQPKTELGKAMKMMVENGDYCEGNIYWLIKLIEQNQEKLWHEKVIEELQERIRDANNLDEFDVVFALENFMQWYKETFKS
jgi:hypothetical protein